MSQTPHFNLDYLMPEQAQKHVTINDALRRLDGLVQLSVKNRTTSIPPAAPENGDRYLVGPEPQDAWEGASGYLALYEDTAWHFIAPQNGWRLWDEAARTLLVFDGENWQPVQAAGVAQPSGLVQQVTTEASVTNGQLAEIPSHVIFLGLTALVIDEITGASSWRIGVAGGTDRFGKGLGVANGTQIRGPADPSVIYWQPTPVIATPQGGQFSGGRMRLSLFYISLPIPEALAEPSDS